MPMTLLLLASCTQAPEADFNSPEPAARNAAIVRAASLRDEGAIPDLVRMLESDDPATRLLAITALERLTGTSLGYDHAASEPARRAGVDAWRARGRADGPQPRSPDAHP